jgi:hypothetical protein
VAFDEPVEVRDRAQLVVVLLGVHQCRRGHERYLRVMGKKHLDS